MPDTTQSPTAKTRWRSPLSAAACFLGLIVCTWADLGSKDWAQTRLSRSQLGHPLLCTPVDVGTKYERILPQRQPLAPLVLIENHLELSYAENCGAAFSMLVHSPSWVRTGLFGTAAIAATIGLLWLYLSGYGGRLFAISVPLIASGAIGNLIDRVRLGYVVDFIRAYYVSDGMDHSWPTFNVADSTITVGVALLLIEGFLNPQKAHASSNASSDASKPAAGPLAETSATGSAQSSGQ